MRGTDEGKQQINRNNINRLGSRPFDLSTCGEYKIRNSRRRRIFLYSSSFNLPRAIWHFSLSPRNCATSPLAADLFLLHLFLRRHLRLPYESLLRGARHQLSLLRPELPQSEPSPSPARRAVHCVAEPLLAEVGHGPVEVNGVGEAGAAQSRVPHSGLVRVDGRLKNSPVADVREEALVDPVVVGEREAGFYPVGLDGPSL